MNRKKGYRLLAVFLFIAFISLISRSLIYLILSTVVAVSIILLLSADRKDRRNRENKDVYGGGTNQKRSLLGALIPAVFLLTGIVMAVYGLSGLTGLIPLLREAEIITEIPAVLIFLVIIGCLLSVYGLYHLLKYWLREGGN